MSAGNCLTETQQIFWLVTYYLQVPETGRLIASIGGLLIILYYLKKGALPGGEILALIFAAALTVCLVRLAIYVVSTPDLAQEIWASIKAHYCSAQDAPAEASSPPRLTARKDH